ncbi:hypothetical protein CERSUDRAFT_106197, partial [Gelatoporia subvermispora B]
PTTILPPFSTLLPSHAVSPSSGSSTDHQSGAEQDNGADVQEGYDNVAGRRPFNTSCDHCRRRKIRCVGDNEPCVLVSCCLRGPGPRVHLAWLT